MERPALCVLDVDGTLLTSRHELTPLTRQAVAAVRDAGARVMLASSRAPVALLPVLQALDAPGDDVFVASQGALTARVEDAARALRGAGPLTALARQRTPLEPARRLARSALAHGVAVNWFEGVQWYVSHVDGEVRHEMAVVGAEPEVVPRVDLLDEAPDKLMLMSPDEATRRALMRDLPVGLQVQPSNPTYLEVTAHGVDKAAAVRGFCDAVGIDRAEVLAAGDGPNDLAVLAWAGWSIAPANAHPDVRAVAAEVTRSNDEDGVARALLDLLG